MGLDWLSHGPRITGTQSSTLSSGERLLPLGTCNKTVGYSWFLFIIIHSLLIHHYITILRNNYSKDAFHF